MKAQITRGRRHAANRSANRYRYGFTMLEILLAMTVLVIIMLMLTTIFDQSASTWESGMRETSRALEGRTILNLIAADLERAEMRPALRDAWVGAGSPRPLGVVDNASSVCFFYHDAANTNGRALKVVRYSFGGGNLDKSVWALSSEPSNPYLPVPEFLGATLLDTVEDFRVYVPGGPYVTNLPEWVDIELVLTEDANAASDIRVRSFGPNGVDDGGSGDDIME